MVTSQAKRSNSTFLIVVVLVIVFLLGSALLSCGSPQLNVGGSARGGTQPTATALSSKSTRAQATATATPKQAVPTATKIATKSSTQNTTSSGSQGSTSAGGSLPQTGIGLGASLAGFLLAGLATGVHWLRQRR